MQPTYIHFFLSHVISQCWSRTELNFLYLSLKLHSNLVDFSAWRILFISHKLWGRSVGRPCRPFRMRIPTSSLFTEAGSTYSLPKKGVLRRGFFVWFFFLTYQRGVFPNLPVLQVSSNGFPCLVFHKSRNISPVSLVERFPSVLTFQGVGPIVKSTDALGRVVAQTLSRGLLWNSVQV